MLVVDSQELDNVGMPELTQYRTFFLEAANRVFLLVERWVKVLSCAYEALVFDGVDGSVGASSQFTSTLGSYSLEYVLLQICCLIHSLLPCDISSTASCKLYSPRLAVVMYRAAAWFTSLHSKRNTPCLYCYCCRDGRGWLRRLATNM